jgi:hypothetical protein
MDAKKYKDIQVNKKNLEIIDNILDALDKYQDRLIDSDMPYLKDAPGIDEEIQYYKKVRRHVINELKEQLKFRMK